MQRNVILLLIALAILLESKEARIQAQSPAGISVSFRDAAEEVLDCLDGAMIVNTSSDQVFEPQSLKCRAMLRKLERSAKGERETSLAVDLHEYQLKITSRHLGGRNDAIDREVAARSKAIQDGGLRAPSAPGS
jgi:hypothetical protein